MHEVMPCVFNHKTYEYFTQRHIPNDGTGGQRGREGIDGRGQKI